MAVKTVVVSIIDRSWVQIPSGVPIFKAEACPVEASETPNLAGWVQLPPSVPISELGGSGRAKSSLHEDAASTVVHEESEVV